MGIPLRSFLSELTHNPMLLTTVLLTLAVILVNGWTDAPNAIATCVSTRALSPRAAIGMAAVCNLLGVVVMTLWNASVAESISQMVDFGDNVREASVALCAAMTAVVVWAVAAWRFGIPTSESHALIAGLTGAAVAMHNGLDGVSAAEWRKVLLGLAVSLLIGFAAGCAVAKLTVRISAKRDRRRAERAFGRLQIGSGAAMAFMHGAQDGQKFLGVFLLGAALTNGGGDISAESVPVWLMLTCALVMSLGTSIGGLRIIKTVGMRMGKLRRYQGFSADLAAALCLLAASLTGIPVSTTHTKTTAMMGAGAAKRLGDVRWGVVGEMLLAWVLTFPCCGAVAYLLVKAFLMIE